MKDCRDIEMRERLPELIHGKLNDPDRFEVETHLAECEDCTAELGLMRGIIESQRTHSPNVSRYIPEIVAALPSYQKEREEIRRIPSGKWHSSLGIAAGLLVAALGVATFSFNNQSVISTDSVSISGQGTGSELSRDGKADADSEGAGLSLIALADLSDEELRGLIDLMETIDVLPTEDPEPLIFDPVMFSDAAQWEDL